MTKKTSLAKSLGFFFLSVLVVLALRWIGFEPYVIPSGSMIPTLLIHDHIVVSKFSYGLRLPFSRKWIWGPSLPSRGDIVVFRSVEKDDLFMIKRVVGLPGDKVKFTEAGDLYVNGEKIVSEPINDFGKLTNDDLMDSPNRFLLFQEKGLSPESHYVMLEKNAFRYTEQETTVGDGMLYLMGDNRDRSRDSRFWGELPIANLLGRAQYVWLSCTAMLSENGRICNPNKIRWQRIFHKIQ